MGAPFLSNGTGTLPNLFEWSTLPKPLISNFGFYQYSGHAGLTSIIRIIICKRKGERQLHFIVRLSWTSN